jgi:cation:H+ antiporter
MEILLQILLLIVGFALLIKGADFFVDGSGSIARKLQIPDIIVGLTIVAMGTSAPELAVSVSAALGGPTEIAMGNVVGSNILNVVCILGISGLISPIDISLNVPLNTLIDIGIFLVTAILCYIFCLNKKINRAEGIVLVVLYVAYMAYAILREPAIQAMFA